MKRLIVCCDGTANDPDQMDRDRIAPTNVVKLTRALKANNNQLIYYDQGVGTGWWAKKFVEGLSGAGISQNIKDAYRFLAQNYDEGDEIYCFGFSRGAFTVRSLCGFIHTCGLLKKEHSNDKNVREIYAAYRATRPNAEPDKYCRANFKAFINQPHVNIKFIGVWDTVGSLGFPLFGSNTFEWNKHHNVSQFRGTVQNAYHAVAIDEFRNQFRPSLFDKSNVSQTLVQKWFAGSHSNIGGGYADTGLSDITLQRMIDHLKGDDFGLEFNEDYINNNNNINPSYFRELRNSRTGFYKVIPVHLRKNNGKIIAAEDLDESVVHRMLDPTTGYAPVNVVKMNEEAEEPTKKDYIKKEYAVTKEINDLDQKFWKKSKVRQDSFPLILANSAAAVLLLWLIGSLFFISSDNAFDISWTSWKSFFLSAWHFILYSIIIPIGFLLGLLGLTVLGFTIGSYFFKKRLEKQIKNKVGHEKY